MKIAITGHRPNKLGNDYDLTSPLIQNIKTELIRIINHHILENIGYDNIQLITGMALGIDTLFAKIAISNNIPFIAAIPNTSQYKIWKKPSQDLYLEIISKAVEVVNVSKRNFTQPYHYQLRNEWMVNNCDLLIAVWDGSPGGTANCVNYAKSINRKMVIINPLDFKQ